ncbi:MAG: TatD family hydrolase [Dehalococcoidia bacterium]
MYIDVHTHIDQHDPSELSGIMERALGTGVGAVISAGVTVESSRRCVEIAAEHPRLFAGVGVHPQDLAGELTQADMDELDRMAGSPQVVTMSEVGLDHQPESPGHAMQERAFRAQIQIARSHGLSIVFHVRESQEAALRVLSDEQKGDLSGAAHYFQGNWLYAKAILDLGFYISMAKPLLRLPELQEVAAKVPLDRIVLETDAYPQPFKPKREKWTEPRDIPLVAAKLAELHEVEVEEVQEHTTQNALEMLEMRGEVMKAAIPAS